MKSYRVLLRVYGCADDVTEAQVRRWLRDRMKGSNFARADVIDCDEYRANKPLESEKSGAERHAEA